ncbi:hypothetical protein [Dialister hominis]|uniref:Uncharacterized protein n=1 Tax=Dialister hominis TaxID=2582419 RepID=A0A8D4UTL5_9FIRM|nr:hypothetical protein [Dialister hominis]BBK24434.1 hypothetical protein Dia5BBH33_03690 [Dialister hominis]
MAKNGMKRAVFFQGDPTFNSVWARWRKEEQEARRQKRAMLPFRVIGIVRMFIRRAGYELLSDVVIRDKKSGDVYRSITERSRS